MSSILPGRIDPWHLCANKRLFEGHFTLDAFNRLKPLLASTEGEAAFTLSFMRDSERRSIVRGSVDADVQVYCQRCLKPMRLAISEVFTLGLVETLEQAAGLPDMQDPLWVDDGELALADIVEDELILAVPIIPRHVEADCSVQVSEIELPAGGEPTRENPFAVLESLKRDRIDS